MLSLGMELNEAIQVIKDRTRKRQEVAKEIGVSRVRLTQIINGNDPGTLLKRSIINWAETQINKP